MHSMQPKHVLGSSNKPQKNYCVPQKNAIEEDKPDQSPSDEYESMLPHFMRKSQIKDG